MNSVIESLKSVEVKGNSPGYLVYDEPKAFFYECIEQCLAHGAELAKFFPGRSSQVTGTRFHGAVAHLNFDHPTFGPMEILIREGHADYSENQHFITGCVGRVQRNNMIESNRAFRVDDMATADVIETTIKQFNNVWN